MKKRIDKYNISAEKTNISGEIYPFLHRFRSE